MIRFIIPGVVGKQRPRTVRIRGGRSATYTPQKTVNFENFVKILYMDAGLPNIKGEAFAMQIDIYFQIPKSYSKKKREDCLCGNIQPTKKPDDDNVVKSISDALNGLAYYDDSQRIGLVVTKNWTEEPSFCEVAIMTKQKIKTLKEKNND